MTFNLIKKTCGLAVLLLLATAPALAQTASVSNLEENYYANLFSDPQKYNPQNFNAGAEEKLFYAATDWDRIFLQTKYTGVTDAYFEELLHSLALPPYNTANPGGWMVSVHFPQNTGHKDVDEALAKYARECFMNWLPQSPQAYAKLAPATWPSKEQFESGNTEFDSIAIIKQLSFITKRLTLIEGGTYVYPGKNSSPVLPYIMTYQIAKPGKNYLSVIFTSWYYEGGAHDMWESRVFNFDLTTGKEVTVEDLLKGPQAEDKVRKYLTAVDKKRRGENGIAAFGSAGDQKLDMQRIALTPDGLVVIYNPYEIGSFAEGSLLYTVSKKEFQKLGISGKFWKN